MQFVPASQNAPAAIAAALACASGVAVLYASWRRWLLPKHVVLLSGWSLIALSFYFQVRASGRELGPVLAALQFSILAWVLVAANRHVRHAKHRLQEPAAVGLPPMRSLLRHATTFLVAVPLAAGASFVLVLVVVIRLPWHEVDRLAAAILSVPVVWGIFSYWTCADPRLLRPSLGLLAAGSLSIAALYL